ncbi:hypothetical protein CK203_013324 [Vitis vinifera]|uniref:Uncharacterized protein n=1 Tax=Vitis vinifera TaxID=29760 RepID=A0A438JQ77_VITVI|nr:hypothetical protein CK203_013324 [Vitis vinifera]
MKSIGELKNLVGLSPGLSSFGSKVDRGRHWAGPGVAKMTNPVPAFIKQLIEKLVFGRFSRVLIFDSSRVWNVILFFWKQASSMKGEVQLEPSGERNPRDSDPLLENQADSSTGSSSEINSEDIEAGSVPCCRICLECDGEPDKAGGMFEKPYAEWVLVSCIISNEVALFSHSTVLCPLQEGFAFSHCTTCKAQYHLQVALFEDNSWRKIKFRLFVARDVFLVFLAVQTVSSVKFA